MLNVMRIDRGTDVRNDCKDASQETNTSEIDVLGYKDWKQIKEPIY